jgi:hypothetical protein
MPKVTKALGPTTTTNVNDPVKPKEIFYILWPEGYSTNPLYGDPDFPKETLPAIAIGDSFLVTAITHTSKIYSKPFLPETSYLSYSLANSRLLVHQCHHLE